MPEWPHDRDFYRIEYPLAERPILVLDGSLGHSVVDCCEQGIRFESGNLPLEPGQEVAGTIRFKRGSEARVSGTILRLQDGQVAMELEEPGIPFSVILAEQRHLRANYPMWPRVQEGNEPCP